MDLYPDVRLQVILTDEELDLSMREADVAIRLRQPVQADLIQRRLFTGPFPRLRIGGELHRGSWRAQGRTLISRSTAF
jgi:DNA-binding transcriptional LysR family regulator